MSYPYPPPPPPPPPSQPPPYGGVGASSFFMNPMMAAAVTTNNYIFLSDEIQLGYALDAFAWAHHKPNGWATANLLRLKSAGIQSMSDLSMGCQEETINLDLELFGIPPHQRLSRETIAALRSFLPGPVGFRCFRLAQMAANKVSIGQATTEYVHRPESGKIGDETFQIGQGGQNWILHVDCAGFVRNCVKHTTKDPMVKCLSDRDFMRAKDFYTFFQSLQRTVMDVPTPSPQPSGNNNNRHAPTNNGVATSAAPSAASVIEERQWRRIDDLRMVIPGDVICYRPRGHAAGGAAFTTNDRKDLIHLLRAVKTAQLWHDAARKAKQEHLPPPAINFAKDPIVKEWVNQTKQNLNSIGIRTIKDLYLSLSTVNDQLIQHKLPPLSDEIDDDDTLLQLIRECAETTAQNTGHIVFCSGPAVDKGNGEYRIRVVHSTKYGRKNEQGEITQGVQEYFRRFERVEERNEQGEVVNVYWTREMSKQAEPLPCTVNSVPSTPTVSSPKRVYSSPSLNTTANASTSTNKTIAVSDDEGDDDNPNDDMEEDPDEVTVGEPVEEEPDELSGQALVEVIAARMCF